LFIFEPLVQGASGMRIYQPEVLDELINIAKSHQIVCIADEVMTGFGRTGKTFATDYLSNKPDIYCLSKGITGGFLPMGVTSISGEIANSFDANDYAKTFFHGHSYTANPLACAAAVESLKILSKKSCQDQIAMISASHQDFVAETAITSQVKEINSLGTVLRIELKVDDPGYVSSKKEQIYDHFLAEGLLIRPLGHVIYILPPYVIQKKELRRIYAAIVRFLN
ncbi:unnamed protein product, partial [Chrysoparadoxa australica]